VNLGLDGRSALVFGGSRGIGAATATALHGEGVKVAFTGRSESSLEPIRTALPGAVGLTADLTVAGDAERCVAEALAAFGKLDLAVISVGAAMGGDFLSLGDEVWAEALELKFMGMVRALRALLPPMAEAGFGRILVVVGNNGRQPNGVLLPGSASNAACLAVIRGLANTVASQGIRINSINPGPTRTDRWTGTIARLAANDPRSEAEIEAAMLAPIPLARVAEPEDIGRLGAMMLSDAADMLVGTSLTPDGGSTRAL
jgi:NAD(P)-dependent dehydrogenase (short-subunit alcohol dehydrogenase family)